MWCFCTQLFFACIAFTWFSELILEKILFYSLPCLFFFCYSCFRYWYWEFIFFQKVVNFLNILVYFQCICCCCEVASVVSDSVRPQRRQPTRLRCPWDSPGKNTGVGCHFLLQCMKVKSEREVAQSCPTLSNPMDCSPPDFSIHGIFQARVLEWGAIAFSMQCI